MPKLSSFLSHSFIALTLLCALPYAYAATPSQTPQTIVLAGGCFWGMEAVFKHVKGVSSAMPGYAGGKADTAHYDMVSEGNTGHAESVQVTYDPKQVSLEQILKVYFIAAHNPTELNYQGPDHGTQYRSAIFYETPEQKKAAETFIAQLDKNHVYSAPTVTSLEPLTVFYPAEEYHRNYAALHPYNPYILMNDAPRVEHFKMNLPDLYVNNPS
jgi:peptide-methionine (S)-S-oxide reductase